MSMEKFEPSSEEKRLSESEAHEEANMLRAKLKVSPETGKIPGGGSEWDKDRGKSFETDQKPTAEDYDNALAAIEELKKIVAEEPIAQKAINKIKDIPLKLGVLAMRALNEVGINMVSLDIDGYEKIKTTIENESIGLFNDAENNLKALKKRAESFAKQEKEHSEK